MAEMTRSEADAHWARHFHDKAKGLAAENHLLRDVLASIVGAFTDGDCCTNCGEGAECCRCVIDLGRTALGAMPAPERD